MFQFPWFASYTYGFSVRYQPEGWWVSPFRDVRITARLPAPRTLSQASTSFIASDCQGIHRMRLVAWLYNPKTTDHEFTLITRQAWFRGIFETVTWSNRTTTSTTTPDNAWNRYHFEHFLSEIMREKYSCSISSNLLKSKSDPVIRKKGFELSSSWNTCFCTLLTEVSQ